MRRQGLPCSSLAPAIPGLLATQSLRYSVPVQVLVQARPGPAWKELLPFAVAIISDNCILRNRFPQPSRGDVSIARHSVSRSLSICNEAYTTETGSPYFTFCMTLASSLHESGFPVPYLPISLCSVYYRSRSVRPRHEP